MKPLFSFLLVIFLSSPVTSHAGPGDDDSSPELEWDSRDGDSGEFETRRVDDGDSGEFAIDSHLLNEMDTDNRWQDSDSGVYLAPESERLRPSPLVEVDGIELMRDSDPDSTLFDDETSLERPLFGIDLPPMSRRRPSRQFDWNNPMGIDPWKMRMPFVQKLEKMSQEFQRKENGFFGSRSADIKAFVSTVANAASMLREIDPKSDSRKSLTQQFLTFLEDRYPRLSHRLSTDQQIELAKSIGDIKQRGSQLSKLHYHLLNSASRSATASSNRRQLEQIAEETIRAGGGSRSEYIEASAYVLEKAIREGASNAFIDKLIAQAKSKSRSAALAEATAIAASQLPYSPFTRQAEWKIDPKHIDPIMRIMIATKSPGDEFLADVLERFAPERAFLNWIDTHIPKMARQGNVGAAVNLAERLAKAAQKLPDEGDKVFAKAEVLARLVNIAKKVPEKNLLSEMTSLARNALNNHLDRNPEIGEVARRQSGVFGFVFRVFSPNPCSKGLRQLTSTRTFFYGNF